MKQTDSVMKLKLALAVAIVVCTVLPAAARTREKVADTPKAPLDAYGDSLPEGAIARLGTQRLRHSGEVRSVAFSPDGSTIASTGGGEVVVWQASTGRTLHCLRGHYGASTAAFSPDGKILASGSQSHGHVVLWDLETGNMLRILQHDPSIHSLAFSPDGGKLAAVTDEGIPIWDVAAATKLRTIKEQADWGGWVVFDLNGKRIRSMTVGKQGKWVRSWNIDTGEQMAGSQAKGLLALSPDGRSMAEGIDGGSVRVWDTDSNKTVFESPAPEPELQGCKAMVFSHDGGFLASAWDGGSPRVSGTLRIFDLKTGKEFEHAGIGAACVAISPDGKLLASGDYSGQVRLWNAATGEENVKESSHPRGIRDVVFSPDAQTVITTGSDGTVCFWDAPSGAQQRVFEARDGTISPDGHLLASRTEDHLVIVEEPATGRVVHTLRGHEDWIDHITFAADGRTLATRDRKAVLRLWDVIRGSEIRKVDLTGRDADIMVFSPDGKVLAFASDGARTVMDEQGTHKGPYTPIILLDTATGKEILTCETDGDALSSLAFSPDGQLLASGHGVLRAMFADGPRRSSSPPKSSNTVRLWDIKTGKPLASFKHPCGVFAVAFSPDARMLASGTDDGKVYFWDASISKDQPITKRAGHGWPAQNRFKHRSGIERGRVNALTFSSDSRLLISGSQDGTALVWDVAALTELAKSSAETVKETGEPIQPPTGPASAAIRLVPDEYPTIQAAIRAANDGDTVIVAPGRYYENISFLGKIITVRSTDPHNRGIVAATIIDGNGIGAVVNFMNGEDSSRLLDGFTITNGNADKGGGIYCAFAGPTIANCIITGNYAKRGAGIHRCNGGPIRNCIITANHAEKGGGLYDCDASVLNCVITDNSADYGGGLCGCNGPVRNCIIANNRASKDGGSALHDHGGKIINCTITANSGNGGAAIQKCGSSITNSIIWGNSPEQLSGSSSPTYSCVDRGADGPGNISDDPRFAGPDASDYHLKPDSPCINAGDPDFTVGGGDTDIDGDARILARRVDIGADEYLGPPLTKATFDSAGSEIVQEILRGAK